MKIYITKTTFCKNGIEEKITSSEVAENKIDALNQANDKAASAAFPGVTFKVEVSELHIVGEMLINKKSPA